MEEGKKEDKSLYCGFGSCRPKCLQFFTSINWFLFFLSIMSLIQGLLINGVTSASIPHLENEFGFTSSQSGMIVASNDLSGILFVLFISYYGDKGKKPKWLALGSITIGIGSLVFVLPKFLKGDYTAGSIGVHFTDYKYCQSNATASLQIGCSTQQHSPSLYLGIFCIAQFIMGLGATPLFTLGAAYLDENVTPKNSPIYIGIWYMTTFIGPSMGYLIGGIFANMYTNLGKVPNNLHPDHALWAGRWWMPYIIFSGGLIIDGFFLILFPKEMPGSAQMRQQAIAQGKIKEKEKSLELDTGIKGFLKGTLSLLSNKTLVFTCLAMASKVLVASGFAAFFTKFLIVKYGANSSSANYYVSVLLLSGTTGGLVIGSVLMRQLERRGSVRVAAIICLICTALGTVGSFAFQVPGCETGKLVGINYRYPLSTYPTDTTDVKQITTCNKDCGCIDKYYEPVCSCGITYFSPCFAGCPNITTTTKMYHNCSCIPTEVNSIPNRWTNYANIGRCDQNCKNMIPYLVLLFFLIVVGFTNGVPNNMLVLRTVPDNQRSFALGLQFLLLRSLAFLPGPVLVGKIVDYSCLVWKYNECGKRSNCAEYDIDRISNYMTIGSVASSLVSFILYNVSFKCHSLESTNKQTLEVSAKENLAFESDTKL